MNTASTATPMADSTEPFRRLVLMRHGQTAWNAERRAQGHSDVDLDEYGAAQAEAAARQVAELAPAAIWSSDLARAASTARCLAEVTGLGVTTDARLREFDLGQRTGLTMTEYAAAHPAEYALFRSGRYDVAPGGESGAVVAARMQAAIKDALASIDPGQVVVVVSHGGALKLAILVLLDLPETGTAALRAMDNCGWAILDETPPTGRLRLTAYNLRASGALDFAGPTDVG
ncbi:MAG: histidine phosphatase family protein [Nocardioides sp.]